MGQLSLLQELNLQYPVARRDESVVDDYHGVKVPDPYRWLEDADADEVKDFVEKQANLGDAVLQSCDTREKIQQQILKLYNHPRFNAPTKHGDKYFYSHNSGLQPQSVLYVMDDLEGKPEVLLDPNTLSEDGTVSLTTAALSEDSKYLAYGQATSGSDWVTIKIKRVDDKATEPDSISWIKFSRITWTHDNKGFFYSCYPAPKEGDDAGAEMNLNIGQEIRYHFLGTDQSEDVLCWKDPEHPKWTFDADVTDDGKYLLLYIGDGTDPVNKFYYCDLSTLPGGLEGLRGKNDMLPVSKLIDNFDALFEVVANDNTVFTFRTNKDAPRYKLVRVDLREPSLWTDVVQEDEKDVLESAHAVNDNQLLLRYLSDCKSVVQLRDLTSGQFVQNIPLDIGNVTGITGRRKDHEVFINFTSFLTPGIIYRCIFENGVPEVKVFREIVVPGFDRAEFQINQVFAPSKDGTKVPMFVVSKKDIVLDGSHPCLLYGYGGFGVSITPSFRVSRIVLMKHFGIVFSIANLRGGGEYGEEWHKAGSVLNKQNAFDDFISAGEYLVSAGYTQPQKLCIEGESNGGLLVAAVVNQRPDLYGCAIANVGVMDMLRFHKFTIAHLWTSEYGCADNEEDFHCLIKYSPLHTVKRPWEQPGSPTCQYPSMMILTAHRDGRVVPLHSLKMLATLHHVLCNSLENSPQTNPIIGRIERRGGHGARRPTHKMIEEASDIYGFMAKTLGLSWQD